MLSFSSLYLVFVSFRFVFVFCSKREEAEGQTEDERLRLLCEGLAGVSCAWVGPSFFLLCFVFVSRWLVTPTSQRLDVFVGRCVQVERSSQSGCLFFVFWPGLACVSFVLWARAGKVRGGV